jgi:glycosyltransferase involved in cell wall biosynthesis
MPEKYPLISCIIPTFNRSASLVLAIKSALSQTYRNIELLVVDDQSADNTSEEVAKIAQTDSRVKYFYNPVKGGNNARNLGIKNATGRYIAFLDDDDTWLPGKLEKQIKPFFYCGPELGVVYCRFKRKSYHGKVSKGHPSKFTNCWYGYILKKLLKRNFITTSTILARADVFESCGGFNPSYKSFQDWELLTRIATMYKFFYIKKVLVEQNESGDSITRDKKGRALTKIKHLKQFKEHYEKNPRILSQRYSSLGVTFFKLKRYGFAKKFFMMSLKYNPFKPGVFLLLLNLEIRGKLAML